MTEAKPGLVKLTIEEAEFIAQEDPDQAIGTPPPMTTGPAPAGCSGSGCVSLSPVPCKAGCSVSASIADRIKNMHAAAGVSGARITEAMPPSSTSHACTCHDNGTCVDYAKSGGMTAAEVKRVIAAANANNLRPVYEIKTQTEYNSLVNQGVPKSNLLVLARVTGPHFSLYGGACRQ